MGKIIGMLAQRGFMTYSHENMIIVAPPLIITEGQLREEMEKMKEVLDIVDKEFYKEEAMAREFLVPPRVIWGKEALGASAEYIRRMGKKALIVTGPHVAALGGVEALQRELEKRGVSLSPFLPELPGNQRTG